MEARVEPDWPWSVPKPDISLSRAEGSGSGGYAYQILAYTAQLFNCSEELLFKDVK
jgi:hypothetical protein